MSEPTGLKSLLKTVNKRDSKESGLAVEGKSFLKKRKGETQEEFERRKKAYLRKQKGRKANAYKQMKDMK